MTPKEKAIEFVTKSVFDIDNDELREQRIMGKKLANFAVDEILKILSDCLDEVSGRNLNPDQIASMYDRISYYEKVKSEISKL